MAKSGWYASYWNAVLFENLLDLNVLGNDIFNCEPLTGKQVKHSATWHYVRTKDICIEIPRYLYKYWTSGSTSIPAIYPLIFPLYDAQLCIQVFSRLLYVGNDERGKVRPLPSR